METYTHHKMIFFHNSRHWKKAMKSIVKVRIISPKLKSAPTYSPKIKFEKSIRYVHTRFQNELIKCWNSPRTNHIKIFAFQVQLLRPREFSLPCTLTSLAAAYNNNNIIRGFRRGTIIIHLSSRNTPTLHI